MSGIFLTILIGCSAVNFGKQTNSSLESKSMVAPSLPPYDMKDNPLSQPTKFETYTDNSSLESKPTGVVENQQNAANTASSTIKGMYVFNNFPSETELVRLKFIRNTMRASLGEIKLCDTMTPDNYRVQSSPCSQDCSCDVSCHMARDCCPDIQHKVINVTVLLNETEQYKVSQKKHVVCTRLHSALNDETSQQAQMPMSQNHSFLYNNLKLAEDLDGLVLTNETAANLHHHGYLVVSSCPTTFTDRTIIDKCIGNDITLIQDRIPVVDRETQQLYKNKYCAICHGIVDTLSWKIETDCIELYTNSCPVNKVKDLVQITQKGQCNIRFKPPKQTSKTAQQCRMEVKEAVISSCNVTGLWTELNQTILALCIKPDTIMQFYHWSGSQLVVYRNVFCYLCNHATALPIDAGQQCMKNFQENSTDDSEHPTFKLVLDVKALESANQNLASCTATNSMNSTNQVKNYLKSKDLPECKQDEFLDMFMLKCRQITCPVYQRPVHHACITKQDVVEGLVLSVQLLVKMAKDNFISTTKLTSNETKHLFQTIYHTTDNYLGLSLFKCVMKQVEVFAKTEKGNIHFFFIQMKVANTLVCTIELLMNMFNMIAANMKILPDDHELSAYNISELQTEIEYRTLPLKHFDFRHTVLTLNEKNYQEISLRPLFNCPSIKLSIDDYDQLIYENVIEKLDDHNLKLQFSRETQTVKICLQTYLSKYFQFENPNSHRQDSSSYDKLQGIICLVATLISMISTVIVLVTYSLFSELRFVPGKLFMILCVNLLLAQFFFSIGNNTGYSVLWCQIIGIGIHFFWLATFSAMNSSLLLMVKSIRCPMKQTNIALIQSKSLSTATKYILYTYSVPLLIVLISLFIGWIKKLPFGGYGGEFCYINTSSMRLYTFAVPILIIIISNFAMLTWIFSLTCYLRINPNRNHQYLIIFLKLSTITGVFWTFGFLYEATNLVYFGFLSTIFNAGQGFFLMWSFIFNKRVLNLYVSLGQKYFYILQGWTNFAAR